MPVKALIAEREKQGCYLKPRGGLRQAFFAACRGVARCHLVFSLFGGLRALFTFFVFAGEGSNPPSTFSLPHESHSGPSGHRNIFQMLIWGEEVSEKNVSGLLPEVNAACSWLWYIHIYFILSSCFWGTAGCFVPSSMHPRAPTCVGRSTGAHMHLQEAVVVLYSCASCHSEHASCTPGWWHWILMGQGNTRWQNCNAEVPPWAWPGMTVARLGEMLNPQTSSAFCAEVQALLDPPVTVPGKLPWSQPALPGCISWKATSVWVNPKNASPQL